MKSGTRSTIWLTQLEAETQGLEPSSAASRVHGSRKLGCKWSQDLIPGTLIHDVGRSSWVLTCCTTIAAIDFGNILKINSVALLDNSMQLMRERQEVK